MLTARDAVVDKVAGLDGGANDYITKPFAIEELLARIRAALRNNINGEDSRQSSMLSAGMLTLVPETREVLVDVDRIDLTKREFDLLYYLLKNKNIVISRDTILQEIWGYDFSGGTNAVDVYIRYLRSKIEEPYHIKLIHTIRGVGYVIKDEKSNDDHTKIESNSDTGPAKDTSPAAAESSGVRKSSSSSSIAVKLNMRMTGRLFAVISSVNLLLIIFGLIFIGWTAEKTVSKAARGMADQPAGIGFYQYGIDKLTIAKTSVPLEGVTINESIYEPFMRDGVKGARRIGLLPADDEALAGGKRVWELKYSLMMDVDSVSYRLAYGIGSDLRIS